MNPTSSHVAVIKRPHGLVYLLSKNPDNSHGYTNAVMSGVRMRSPGWADIEPVEGVYGWALPDQAVANAKTHGKQIGISSPTLSEAPDWLQARRWTLPATDSGNEFTVVLPWDAAVQPALLAFIVAQCKHFEGVDYIAMTGLGARLESFITPDPDDVGETMASGLQKWTDSCNKIIDTYAANLKCTPFIFTAAKPFDGRESAAALTALITAACKKYPGRFGVMNASLNANATTGYVPNKLVSDNALTNPCGLQFLTSSGGFGGHDLGGSVEDTIKAGIVLEKERGFIEIYALDADDPANVNMLTRQGKRLS